MEGSISERASPRNRERREPKKPQFIAMSKVGNGWQRIGCEFRFNPAGDSDLKPATIPI